MCTRTHIICNKLTAVTVTGVDDVFVLDLAGTLGETIRGALPWVERAPLPTDCRENEA